MEFWFHVTVKQAKRKKQHMDHFFDITHYLLYIARADAPQSISGTVHPSLREYCGEQNNQADYATHLIPALQASDLQISCFG